MPSEKEINVLFALAAAGDRATFEKRLWTLIQEAVRESRARQPSPAAGEYLAANR